MPVRVVNVRAGVPCIYVGRAMPGRFAGHPLGNPFRVSSRSTLAEREDCLARYRQWLDAHPERDALLQQLAEEVLRTGLPLGCWCCAWDGVSEPKPLCHAVVLAERVGAILTR